MCIPLKAFGLCINHLFDIMLPGFSLLGGGLGSDLSHISCKCCHISCRFLGTWMKVHQDESFVNQHNSIYLKKTLEISRNLRRTTI